MSGNKPITVLLASEGTYPFYHGGVSTWCHRLTNGLPNVDFKLLSVVTNPFQQVKYELSANVIDVLKIPQWGLVQPAEYSHHQPTSTVLRNRWNTTPEIITRHFKPLFEQFLALTFSPKCDKGELGHTLLKMQLYFQHYDYPKTMNSPEVWNVLQHAVRATWENRPEGTENPTLAEVKQASRLLYHLLMILHFPIPEADLTHSSAASFCGIACVLARIAHDTPYLLTEHGVYLREQYLNLRRQIKSFFVRWFLYRLCETVVELNYHYASQVSPVCAYNARWEKRLGVEESRIDVIFNGVDPAKFQRVDPDPRDHPLVSTVGLIYQLKGQIDMIDSTAIIKEQFPDVEVRFYGTASDQKYYDDCKKKVIDLKLEKNVNFAGSTKEPWKVYSNADVVAFSSISEGFPYVVVEAMLCGAAIISTDVGGVREALGEAGILVPAKQPRQMAEAVSFLLANPQERERLGKLAKERALEYFTEETFLNNYESTYHKLVSRRPQRLLRA